MTPVNHSLAASLLTGARQTRGWLSALPNECRPHDAEDAYAIQIRVIEKLGPVGGWKVGAGNPEALPACAAITQATIIEAGAQISAENFHVLGIEAEIAYRLTRDLPRRNVAYTSDEILDTIGSVHPVIEVADTRFSGWGSQDRLSHVADQLNHGALIVGDGIEDWRRIDPATQRVTLTINGVTVSDVVGGNPAGDPLRLILWLANEGARPFGGLRAGNIITTGSLTGVVFQKSPAEIRACMPGLGNVNFSIGR
jgi:2-keto-4-pentenoate hydratase